MYFTIYQNVYLDNIIFYLDNLVVLFFNLILSKIDSKSYIFFLLFLSFKPVFLKTNLEPFIFTFFIYHTGPIWLPLYLSQLSLKMLQAKNHSSLFVESTTFKKTPILAIFYVSNPNYNNVSNISLQTLLQESSSACTSLAKEKHGLSICFSLFHWLLANKLRLLLACYFPFWSS